MPRAPRVDTLIEFTHRITSGIAFLLVAGLLAWAIRLYSAKNKIRQGAKWAMIFMVLESLVGASLVLFEWVAGNISLARVIVMAVHLVNTHFLLASISLTAWWASGEKTPKIKLTPQGWMLLIGLLATLLMSAAGAVTALGDTLFPSDSLAEGIRQDLDPASHFLVQLRVLHPFIAIVVGLFLAFAAGLSITSSQKASNQYRLAWGVIALYGIQLLAGMINLLLLAPVWMQIVHLLLADLVWIVLVLLTNETLPESSEHVLQQNASTGQV